MPTKKAEPPPTRDINRDSGTASANGGSGDLTLSVKPSLVCVIIVGEIGGEVLTHFPAVF